MESSESEGGGRRRRRRRHDDGHCRRGRGSSSRRCRPIVVVMGRRARCTTPRPPPNRRCRLHRRGRDADECPLICRRRPSRSSTTLQVRRRHRPPNRFLGPSRDDPRGPGGMPWFIVDFLFVIASIGGTQYIFYVFPRRIFGEASFFSEASFFDHEKSPWHAGRMPRATPKPWRTLAPSRRSNLQPMIDMPICRGPMSSDSASRKQGSSVILE